MSSPAQTLDINGWHFHSSKQHMMESRCNCTESASKQCDFCRFSAAFRFPLPGEVFANSVLTLQHAGGLTISFDAMGALGGVNKESAGVEVSHAADWRSSRPAARALEAVKDYDWTFTSSFRGHVAPPHSAELSDARIDLESLKAQEKILFYDDVYLFADDFGDNGLCSMNVRMRVMPSGFFVLQREYIRVDRVLVRVRDTRLHHRFGWDHVLREHGELEGSVAEVVAALRPIGLDERALFQDDKVPLVVERLRVQREVRERIALSSPSPLSSPSLLSSPPPPPPSSSLFTHALASSSSEGAASKE